MNEEPVFSDRLIPILAIPGVLLSAALFVLDWLNGKELPSWGFALLLTALLGFFSVVILAIPLYIVAKFQILRSKGLTRTKTVGMMIFGLCLIIVAGMFYRGAGKLFEWLFESSRFYVIIGCAFVLLMLIFVPYTLFRERKERGKLNMIDANAAQRTDIVRK
jgi:hypothetical protein